MNNFSTLIVPRKRMMYDQVVNVLGKYRCTIALIRPYKETLDFYDVAGIDSLSVREKRHMFWELVNLEIDFLTRGVIIG